MTKSKHVFILCPYPQGTAASQRFRFEQYLPFLREQGFRFSTHAFLSEKAWQDLYKRGKIGAKLTGVLAGFIRRTALLFRLSKADLVFIHREAAPVGPPVFEWFIARVLRKPIIYDFDDAIWLQNTSAGNAFVSRLKWHRKTGTICRLAHRVSCGNAFLADYALNYAQDVRVVPTTIDLNLHQGTINHAKNKTVIGWTGTHSTVAYLLPLIPVLKKLALTHPFQLCVISDRKPEFEADFLEFIPWSKAVEIEQMKTFAIGLMPLPDTEWARGKCAFKALQYMALGIPSVVSPVGMNLELIDHGTNGFLAGEPDEWYDVIKTLLESEALRQKTGLAGQQTVRERYSTDANRMRYLDLFS